MDAFGKERLMSLSQVEQTMSTGEDEEAKEVKGAKLHALLLETLKGKLDRDHKIRLLCIYIASQRNSTTEDRKQLIQVTHARNYFTSNTLNNPLSHAIHISTPTFHSNHLSSLFYSNLSYPTPYYSSPHYPRLFYYISPSYPPSLRLVFSTFFLLTQNSFTHTHTYVSICTTQAAKLSSADQELLVNLDNISSVMNTYQVLLSTVLHLP